MNRIKTEHRWKAPRRYALVAAGLLMILIVAFLAYFPGRKSLLALTLASGIGVSDLQARVDALEQQAIDGQPFSEADRAFLQDLYTSFAKGARLTYVLRQSGRLMDRYLSRTGEPLQMGPRIFLGSRNVREQMDLLRQRIVEDWQSRDILAEAYSSETFHMGEPELFDSSVGLYFGRISVRPRPVGSDRLRLRWRAELPWQWPSYQSLYDKYGDYHAQCFPLPNARSLLGGPEYYLWVDDGLGGYLAQIGLAAPFLAWAEWDEEVLIPAR
jgi:hypothetical protein